MKKVSKFFKVLLYPMMFIISEFIVQYVFVSNYNKHILRILKNNYPFISKEKLLIKLNLIINTSEYKDKLNNYLNSKILVMLFIISIVFIPLFYSVYKKYQKKEKSLKIPDVVFIGLLAMSTSLIFNITMYNINNFIPVSNNYKLSKIPMIVQIISSGIIGPILEELLFRGIVYNKLKEFLKSMQAIIGCSIIFALFHISSPLNTIYSFMMSFMFIYLYEKYKNLNASILMHIIANLTVIIMLPIILKNIIWLNLFILFLMIIILMFIYLSIIKGDMKKYKKKQ